MHRNLVILPTDKLLNIVPQNCVVEIASTSTDGVQLYTGSNLIEIDPSDYE